MIYNQAVQTVIGENLSDAWAKAFLMCHKTSGGVMSPGIVRFGIQNEKVGVESTAIREILVKKLQPLLKNPSPLQDVVETVAGTIFPESIWTLAKGDRKVFFKMYERMIPRIRHVSNNRRGTYFERLVAFEGANGKTVNQLDHIINIWHAGNRRHGGKAPCLSLLVLVLVKRVY